MTSNPQNSALHWHPRRPLSPLTTGLILAAVVLIGTYLRLIGIDWDENQHLHPDERFLTMVTTSLTPVSSINEYFNTTTSSLNPNNTGFGFYVYGDLPVILTRYLGQLVGKTGYFDVYLVGRAISAVTDLLTVILIFFIGKVLFDERVGLIGAGLYSSAALAIQLSHFYTVDTVTNLFVTASFLVIALAHKRHNWIDYPLFGLTLGLAVASKINVAPLALIFALVLWLRYRRESAVAADLAVEDDESDRLQFNVLRQAVAGLVIAGLVSFVSFRAAQPYAFLQPNSGVPIEPGNATVQFSLFDSLTDPLGLRLNPLWLNQMDQVRQQVSGYSDIPPNHQWGQRLPLVFPWINMVRVGMGWPMGIMCWLGFLWAVWEIARRHRLSEALIMLVAWVGLYFTWQGVAWVKTMRYFLPVYPMLAILGGWLLVTQYDRIGNLIRERNASGKHPLLVVSTVIPIVVLVATLAWGFAVSRIYTRPVTRVAASDWIYKNVPSDLTMFVDTGESTSTYELGIPNNFPILPPTNSPEAQSNPEVSHSRLYSEMPLPIVFEAPVAGTISKIRINHLVDLAGNGQHRQLFVKVWSDEVGTTELASGEISGEFSADSDPRGGSYEVPITPIVVSEGQKIYFVLQPDEQGPLDLFSATVTTEGEWDDPLPLPLSNYNTWGAQYQGYELQMAWEDIPEKRQRIISILDRTDYLFISSNRFYASMPRNPERFPLTVEYYRALFSGELGFELVGDFTSRPSIGPIEFYDDDAEEAWTVYDHPRVLVFKKTAQYSTTKTVSILDAVDLNSTLKIIAKDAKGTPVILTPPTLSTTSNPLQGEVGGVRPDTAIEDFYRTFQPLLVVMWWLAITLIGALSYPILHSLFASLSDRAFPMARLFGILLAGWLAWLISSIRLASWGYAAGLISLLTIGVISAIILFRQRRYFFDWAAQNRRHIIFLEILSLVLFLFFLLVRIGNPDLWHPSFGGEKPMDMAYFNAVLNSQYFPPYDPWFYGGTINYYYFGFVIVGLPVKLLSIPATLGYNLILPTLFSMTGTAAFSVAYNLSAKQKSSQPMAGVDSEESEESPKLGNVLKAWPNTTISEVWTAAKSTVFPSAGADGDQWQPYLAGAAALLLGLVLGNLDQIRTLLFGLAEVGSGAPQWANTLLPAMPDVMEGLRKVFIDGQLIPVGLGEWYWNATRLIPVPINEAGSPTEVGPITEFPYFTFIYADLHAHMIAMPITLLALNWCVSQVKSINDGLLSNAQSRTLSFSSLAVGALIIGALRPTNTWDWPTYLAIGALSLILAEFYRRGAQNFLPTLIYAALSAGAAGGIFYSLISSVAALDPNMARVVLPATAAAAVLGLVVGFSLGLAIVARGLFRSGTQPETGLAWKAFLIGLIQAAILAALTFVFYLPYIFTYRLGYTNFIPWQGSRTPAWAYVDILGLFLYLIISWIVAETIGLMKLGQLQRQFKRAYWFPAIGVLIIGAATVALLLSSGLPTLGVAVPLIIWATILFSRSELAVEKRLVLGLIVFALAMSLVVEVIVLDGDISRMNTVFKFYLQVWLLLAISSGAALSWLWPSIARLRDAPRTVWLGALSVMVFLAALYPLLATRAKIDDRWSSEAPNTLDGMAFMQYVDRFENGEVIHLAPDYDAIRWLQDHVTGTPLTLEAHTVEYNWGNRVTVYTGFPAIVGWNWHQRQQRAWQSDEVWARVADIDRIYQTQDEQTALTLLKKYGVRLIVVGGLERAYYAPVGLAKFEQMANEGLLKRVYDQNQTAIYQVVEQP